MYRKPTLANLQEFGKSWVDHLFEDFCNSKFRGPNFTWENFPGIVARLACANLPMSYKSSNLDETKLKEIVMILAEEKMKGQL